MELARGGMGTVEIVLRKDGGFRRLLAIKRLLPAYRDDPTFRDMFLDEARVAGLLRHPNVVSVIDVGDDADGPFLVMEYVEGASLASLIRDARRRSILLPVQVCVRIAADIARGLHAAHELRAVDGTPLELVHRDVTPQNVLLSYDGEVRVADFGIAKALGRSSRTSTGILKGKLGYISPEQLRFREPDRRSDLFSLGVVLFEMLASQRLYASDGLEGARRILDEPPPDIVEHRDDVPDAVVELLFDLLAKVPDDRPATAEEVATRLDVVLVEMRTEEEAIRLGDFLATHLADEQLRARAALAHAMREAERASVPAPPTPASWPWRATAFALGGALLAAGIGAGAWAAWGGGASDGGAALATDPVSESESVAESTSETDSEPEPASESEPEPASEAASEVASEPDSEPARPRSRARAGMRRAETPPPEEPATAAPAEPQMTREIPRWGWE
jgi:serine/threonine-protein kinase